MVCFKESFKNNYFSNFDKLWSLLKTKQKITCISRLKIDGLNDDEIVPVNLSVGQAFLRKLIIWMFHRN